MTQPFLCLVAMWTVAGPVTPAHAQLAPGDEPSVHSQDSPTSGEHIRSSEDWGEDYRGLIQRMHSKVAANDPAVDSAFNSAADALRAIGDEDHVDSASLIGEYERLVAQVLSGETALSTEEDRRLSEFARVIDETVRPTLRIAVETASLPPQAGASFGMDVKYHGVSNGRLLGIMLAARARHALEQHDTESALESIEASLACARYVERWPSLTTRQLALHIRTNTVRSVLGGAHRYPMRSDELRDVLDLLERQPLAQPRFAGEAEWMLQRAELDRVHAELVAGGGEVDPDERAAEIDRMGRFRDLFTEMLDPETKAIRRSDLGARINKAAAQEAERERTPVFWSLLPPVGKLVRQEVDLRTAEDALLSAWAMSLFRERSGQWPSSLFELSLWTARIPMDHYWGLPMRYKVIDPEARAIGQGIVLYSVGKDVKDDGGDPERDELFLGGY